MTGEKVFVTGGTGFIGDQLVKRLLGQDNEVFALVRAASQSKIQVQHPNFQSITGDLFDTDQLKRGMEGCRYIFHLAGLAQPWAPAEKDFYDVNLRGTQNVLDAARSQGVERVLFTSTAGLLASSDSGLADESTPRKRPFITPYEASKYEAEQLVRSYSTANMSTVVVNPPRVFGPGKISKSNAVTELIKRYVMGHWRWILGDGSSIGNYGYIDDVVSGHVLAMLHGKPGERYMIGGTNLSFNEFFAVLARVSGIHRKMIHLPLWVALSIAHLEKWKADTFGIAPLITPDWLRKYHYNWALSSAKAEKELGYTFTPIEQAFEQTIQWLRK